MATPPDLCESDLLTHIALSGSGGATLLTRMRQICRTWRTAVDEDAESTWRTLALRRFPRLHLILKHEPGPHDFRTVYRQQLMAEQGAEGPSAETSYPPLDAYIFLVEVQLDSSNIGSWSGVLEASMHHWASMPIQWTMPAETLSALRSEVAACSDLHVAVTPLFASLLCTVCVTRRADLSTLVMYKGRVDEGYFEVNGERDFGDTEPESPSGIGFIFRYIHPPMEEVVFGEDSHHSVEMNPEMMISLTEDSTSSVYMGFSKYTRDYGTDNLETKDLRKYLFFAPWPSTA